MAFSNQLTQTPAPGCGLIRFCGDAQDFSLTLAEPAAGRAGVRTNLGHAAIRRRDLIDEVDADQPHLERDWFDVFMTPHDDRSFRLRLPLTEVGHFEAKAFFLAEGSRDPVWVPGGNIRINVEPAETCCANIVYNAFIRQFGPNQSGGFFTPDQLADAGRLDEKGWVVIPPSGSFRDFIQALDFIVGTLGCRWIQLLPIHPTPTTYGRMGRYGSPYAALSFTAVDPALAVFDSAATPLEQFIELINAVHARNARLLLDIAINHTGWAAGIHESHPEWLVRSAEGRIEMPGAWGVRWEDLTRLDYTHRGLWRYMADVFLTWCRRGIDGFRCDAGYMIPVKTWRYIIAAVREQFPETVFFLEGLGGKTSVTRRLLDDANFNWAYSELFQNYDREQISSYLPLSVDISQSDGTLLHYAETHDNPRLAARSHTWAKMRTALCALLSLRGAFGFANGVEWFAEEKINVHESMSLNWNAAENQVDAIGRLTALLKAHPAFHDGAAVQLLESRSENAIAVRRHDDQSGKALLVLVSLDDTGRQSLTLRRQDAHPAASSWTDLLSGRRVTPQHHEDRLDFTLEPGEVLCLSDDAADLSLLEKSATEAFPIPRRIALQRRRAKVLEVYRYYNGADDLGGWDIDAAAAHLMADPIAFCRQMNPYSHESRVIVWRFPVDTRREVMLPPGHLLLVEAPHLFRARLWHDDYTLAAADALPSSGGGGFALFLPPTPQPAHRRIQMHLVLHQGERSRTYEARLLQLGEAPPTLVQRFDRRSAERNRLRILRSNVDNAALLLPVQWGRLESRYDALLAANFQTDVPADRWIMLTRCRMWVVCQDYAHAVTHRYLDHVAIDDRLAGTWVFRVPTGRGRHILLRVHPELRSAANQLVLALHRESAGKHPGRLPDFQPIDLIVRPDLEDRSFHATTKAYQGPEHLFPAAVRTFDAGFIFQPDKAALKMGLSRGNFVKEPEWHYMVNRREDGERGFDADADLFSPGYFKLQLTGGTTETISAAAYPADDADAPAPDATSAAAAVRRSPEGPASLAELAETAMQSFIVRRGRLQTVIAGYPWFLDWGRDALIFARGLIRARKLDCAQKVLTLFGRFEENGTLPNMLLGDTPANRDTSDAPLWFCIACSDLVRHQRRKDFLDQRCGDRSIRDILTAIGHAYVKGTSNGIQMDPATGLVYSPSHFTWMDTNHPAGSPRQGYPIEIQALWHRTLRFLHSFDRNGTDWRRLADRVRKSILHFYFRNNDGYLADCLHADAAVPPHEAHADDALRPNQLLAITMNAVVDRGCTRQMLEACQTLLVPGAIRSLADRPLKHPLEIRHNDRLLADPRAPYQGRYTGDEDTQRKPAYHNGTAWTWLFPSFCEAWVHVFGDSARSTAVSWLYSTSQLLRTGCIGHVPEILDGDAPHQQRGCPAQAWGISEFYRVLSLLTT